MSAKGKVWAPCPDATISDSEEEEFDDTLDQIEETENEFLLKKDSLPATLQAAAEALNIAAESSLGGASRHVPLLLVTDEADLSEGEQGTDDSSSSSDEELRERLKQVELLEMQVRVQQEKEAAADQERLERKQQRRIKREKELTALKQKEKQLKQQIRVSKAVVPPAPVKPAAAPAKPPKPTTAPVKDPATKQKVLSDQVAEHEARRQRRAADKKAKHKAESCSLTIDNIRKIPDVQQQALELMNKLQNMIPSLAADPLQVGILLHWSWQLLLPAFHLSYKQLCNNQRRDLCMLLLSVKQFQWWILQLTFQA